MTTVVKDKEGNERTVTVTADEGMRKGVGAADLAKLKPAFKKGGTTTAGNSSQVTAGKGSGCKGRAGRYDSQFARGFLGLWRDGAFRRRAFTGRQAFAAFKL